VEESISTEINIKRGILAIFFVFMVYCGLQLRDGLLVPFTSSNLLVETTSNNMEICERNWNFLLSNFGFHVISSILNEFLNSRLEMMQDNT
jgi:hypothetical protein